MAKIAKSFVRVSLWTLAILLALVLSVSVIVSLETVQYRLVNRVIDDLQELTNNRIELSAVKVSWFDCARVEGLRVYDEFDSLMLDISQLNVNFNLIKMYRRRALIIDKMQVNGAMLHLIKHNDSTFLNISQFVKSIKRDVDKQSQVRIRDVTVTGATFFLDDNRFVKKDSSRLDFSHLSFDFPEVNVTQLQVEKDTINFRITRLSGTEQRVGMPINRLMSVVRFDPNHLLLGELSFETDVSLLRDSLAFTFKSLGDWTYFKDSVQIYSNLNHVELGVDDISRVTGIKLDQIPIGLDGILTGTFNEIVLRDSRILIGDKSSAEGSFAVSNTSSPHRTYDLNFSEAKLNESDIQKVGRISTKTGDVQYTGQIKGPLDSLVVSGTINDRRGSVHFGGHVTGLSKGQMRKFETIYSFDNYELAEFLPQAKGLRINGSGYVRGDGPDWKKSDYLGNFILLNSELDQLSFDSILFDFTSTKGFVDWKASVADKVLKLEGDGSFYTPDDQFSLIASLNISKMDLLALRITNDSVITSGRVEMSITGSSIDDLNGYVDVDRLLIERGVRSWQFDEIKMLAKIGEDQRIYELAAPGLTAELNGDFKPSDLINDIPQVALGYWQLFTRQDVKKLDDPSGDRRYYADLKVQGSDLGPYFKLVDLPYDASSDANLDATFARRSDTYLTIYAAADTIFDGRRILLGNELDVNASKDLESSSVLALFYLESRYQNWTTMSDTRDFRLESVWNNEYIDADFQIVQPENDNHAQIKSRVTLLRDTIEFRIKESKLFAFGNNWNTNEDNLLRWVGNRLVVESMEFYDKDESVSLNGTYGPQDYTLLEMDVQNFQLRNLSALLPRDFGGVMNSKGSLVRIAPGEPAHYSATVAISALEFEGFEIGDLKGTSEWNTESLGLTLDYDVHRDYIEKARLKGVLRPLSEANQIDAKFEFDQMHLNWLQPLFTNSVSNLSGEATGDMYVTGSLVDPRVRGSAHIEKGNMTINYLNTDYLFTGDAQFERNVINLSNVQLNDRLGNGAQLEGFVTHKNLKGDEMDLQIDFTNFELLNTSKYQNSLYYGTAYGTGQMTIKGSFDNVEIKANATSNSNTRIFVPFEDQASIQQGDYITFFDPEEEDLEEVGPELTEYSEISLDLSVDLTPDAYIELIFDPLTGDIIRGRAAGNLQMNMTRSGDFEMFGHVEVDEGAYNWTTNLINKEFNITPGGTISFYGDPYEGILDLEATYRQIADASDLDPVQSEESENTLPNTPVLVVLGLDGPMARPDISFRLELDEANSGLSIGEWRDIIARINGNQEELKRQVFSLLLLRKFSPYDSFVVGGSQGGTLGEGLGNSVSEFMSNQLSYWLNQMDENLEVSIDLTGLDQEAFETFQLRLAYTFLDGRLRVSSSSGMQQNVTDPEYGNSATYMLGDWSVDYVLTEDGRLRVKVFSQTNQHRLDEDNTLEAGVSLRYVRSFDEFKELLGAGRKKGQKKKTANAKSTASSSEG